MYYKQCALQNLSFYYVAIFRNFLGISLNCQYYVNKYDTLDQQWGYVFRDHVVIILQELFENDSFAADKTETFETLFDMIAKAQRQKWKTPNESTDTTHSNRNSL